MRKKYLAICLLLFGCASCFAQVETERQVIATSGNSGTNGDIEVEWTLGEPIVGMEENMDISLSQGFHQTYLIITNILDIDEISCKVYPNPTKEFVMINIPDNKDLTTIEVLDLQGKTLYSTKSATTLEQIDVRNYAIGTYIINVKATNGMEQFRIQKISK